MSSLKQSPRYYVPHHLVFYPVMGFLFFSSLNFAFRDTSNQWVWTGIALCFFSVIALSYMLRQHYALGNQDRIVRLEMRYRYFATTGKRFEPFEKSLSFKQIAALRFASDNELTALTEEAVLKKLTPAAIKENIQNWIVDDMRL